MWCAACNNDISDCVCEVKAVERLASLRNDPNFIYKMCRKCEKHYAFCKCEEPDWTTSHDGVELEDVKKMKTLRQYLDEQ